MRASMYTTTIKPKPIMMPGMAPPSKSLPTDCSVTRAQITIMMLGGMMGPMHADEAVRAAENFGS